MPIICVSFLDPIHCSVSLRNATRPSPARDCKFTAQRPVAALLIVMAMHLLFVMESMSISLIPMDFMMNLFCPFPVNLTTVCCSSIGALTLTLLSALDPH